MQPRTECRGCSCLWSMKCYPAFRNIFFLRCLQNILVEPRFPRKIKYFPTEEKMCQNVKPTYRTGVECTNPSHKTPNSLLGTEHLIDKTGLVLTRRWAFLSIAGTEVRGGRIRSKWRGGISARKSWTCEASAVARWRCTWNIRASAWF